MMVIGSPELPWVRLLLSPYQSVSCFTNSGQLFPVKLVVAKEGLNHWNFINSQDNRRTIRTMNFALVKPD